MTNNSNKRSPLKATQWKKRGYVVPKDSDGAYRVLGRLDGQNIASREAQDFLTKYGED